MNVGKFSFSTVALMVGLGVGAGSAQDAAQWAGFYAGLTFSTGTADQTYDSGPSYDLEGDGFGGIAGYNYANGPWVFGGEVAYSRVEIGELPPNTDYTFTSFLDLKARAGYAMGNALFYGTIGGTFTQWQEGSGNGGFDGDGLLYGVGVDFLVSPRLFVGAEYLRRDVTSDWTAAGDTFDADPSTFSLRTAFRF